MEKIKNSLFLNYERQNGKLFDLSVSGKATRRPSGLVHSFPEYLVPGTSDNQHNMLTSMANSLYIEARRANMSISPFGHADPIKFILSATFLPLLMTEVKRDLAITGKYEFGNVNFGYALSRAARFDLNDAMGNIANYCKRYNILASKINALYVPVSGLLQRWVEHRFSVFKDDEGERYSLYLYCIGNYYELDTDPNSPTVGQVMFKALDWNAATTIGEKLDLIETIVNKYSGDDDFSAFCTEALKANMSRLTMTPIKSNEDNWELPVLSIKYKLDDILSLENACFNIPVYTDAIPVGTAKCDWNVTEDPTTGILTCGHIGAESNRLPVYKDGFDEIDDDLPGVADCSRLLAQQSIESRFLFTHAKIKSIEGLTSLTRYVNSYGLASNTSLATTPGKSKFALAGQVVYSEENPTSISCVALTGYGTEILGIPTHFYATGSGIATRTNDYRLGYIKYCMSTNLDGYLDAIDLWIGFKARIFSVVYEPQGNECHFEGGDFDYITTVTKDSLDTFFGINAWNDIQLISSYSESNSNNSNQ